MMTAPFSFVSGMDESAKEKGGGSEFGSSMAKAFSIFSCAGRGIKRR